MSRQREKNTSTSKLTLKVTIQLDSKQMSNESKLTVLSKKKQTKRIIKGVNSHERRLNYLAVEG